MVTICTAQWSQLCTTSLTFTHSTFCPHGVFVCFVLIWEQTAIISLYGISWLVCITDYMYRTMVTICTTSLTFTHSTFCPHSVFVSIWEPTSIISLHNINWLVCVTETECVYCAVRTGSLHSNSTSILRGCPRVICSGWSASGSGYCPSTSLSPVSITPPMLHTHLHLHVALPRRTHWRSLGTLQTAMLLRKPASVGYASTATHEVPAYRDQ